MWITRLAFDSLTAERIKAVEEARVLAQQNTSLQITLDWFRHRLEQVERERAHLLKTYMGVVVSVPTFVKPEPDTSEVLGGSSIFNDVGDEEAKRRNIQWDADGTVKQ